ncbi:SNF2 family DNA or RNA helicase [Mobilisporobacter senegalensis]|uniref:SNF2 family DNA or RNA helicase n=1 Tax=Mobilisporobacter senegalensis TaxID=1329262 RepID=A0A3N1XWI1_9FIRM|nr:DEAD/DEAH box helicase [Mobilisporobacter senegalensis]ROR29297.1 SNF2 family DNA or RNA helicase [Mobilisporobacter senegalensis]
MIQLSRASIRKIAINDAVYSRGLRYYNNKAILNVAWSKQNKQYHAIVHGKSDYGVTIDVKDDGNFSYHCNCPASVKYNGACKHVVATLLFLYDYNKKSDEVVPSDPEEKKIYNILEYFDKDDLLNNFGEIFHLELNIQIPNILKKNTGKAYVSFQVGSTKLYKVQSIKKFLTDIANHNNITLGKNFNYVAGESRFDPVSKGILDYFLEIFEIQESLGKVYYSNLFSKNQMIFTQNMLLKLLSLTAGGKFNLELYGKMLEEITFVPDNPKIKYQLNIDEDSITLDYNGKENVIPVAENGELLYCAHVLYNPNKIFIKNYVPFYNNLGKNKEPLIFKGEYKNKFLERVLPKIHETMNIDIPSNLKDQYITSDLKVKIFLDQYKASIKADIKFQYDDFEFNPLEPIDANKLIIIRQMNKENQIFDTLERLNFEPYKNCYIMRDDKSIYELLSGNINELSNICELYYSEEFRKIKINKPSTLSTNVRVSSEIDLLEIEFDYDNIPKEELKDIFQSIRLKKKYFRLKNGDFININDKNINQMLDIMEHLNLSSKDMKEDKIRLSKSSAVYLNSYLSGKEDINVNKDKEYDDFIHAIMNPKESSFQVPSEINANLRPYQITGYKWLKTLSLNNLGGILADDMGLGKTLQAIVYIASCALAGKEKPHLIVCPSSLVYNWQSEIEKFAPMLKTIIVSGTPEDRKAMIDDYKNVNVLITSYPLIRRDIEHYEKVLFDTMFIDEAQYIKNPNSLNAKSVKKIVASHRFALTGTPIENSLSELWSIFDYIMPNYLFSHIKFSNRFEKPIMKEDTRVLEDLGKRIHPFILRRMKKEVLKELPEKFETKMVTDLTEQQRKIYLSYMDEIKEELSSKIKDNTFQKNQMQILAALTRLRQICCHPSTFIDNYKGGSGKLELLMELIPEALSNDHRILIFSQFTSMLKIIEEELNLRDISYFYLEGSTPIETRNDYVKRFNEGEGSIFLISLKAGGTGLNLTGADTVIHYDPWWNPAVEEQATDRAYRIGQTNAVHVIKLLSKGTIEEKIFKLQEKKRELSESIIQSKEVFINKLSKEELQDIFDIND